MFWGTSAMDSEGNSGWNSSISCYCLLCKKNYVIQFIFNLQKIMSLANLCQRFSRMMTTTNLKTTHKFVTSRCIMINLSIHLLSWPWPPCKMQTKLILYFWTLDLTLALGTCDSLTGSIVCATIAHFCSNNTFYIENQGLRSCPLISCYTFKSGVTNP